MVKIARNPIFAAKKPPQTMIFIKKQAKPLIFHGFPCQNFPTVNPNSRHAYRGCILVLKQPDLIPATVIALGSIVYGKIGQTAIAGQKNIKIIF